jgi:hypothetical protein
MEERANEAGWYSPGEFVDLAVLTTPDEYQVFSGRCLVGWATVIIGPDNQGFTDGVCHTEWYVCVGMGV